jgi:hypothetical protein
MGPHSLTLLWGRGNLRKWKWVNLVASCRMSIIIVCPGCRKRYAVNEKFAGKTGHCPNCKHPIRVPAPPAEFKVHTPEEFADGGRSTTDMPVLKPIAREQTKFNPLAAAGIACAATAIFAAAFLGGNIGLLNNHGFFVAAGLAIISPLLALAGYSFLYDDELEPYKGNSLYIRSAICGLSYALLWGAFAYVSDIVLTGEVWNWVFVAPPFFAAGTMIAVTTFDLEYGNGFFHYSFYLLVIILLRWTAGLGWIWDINVK